jgi:hypothetical protein
MNFSRHHCARHDFFTLLDLSFRPVLGKSYTLLILHQKAIQEEAANSGVGMNKKHGHRKIY